MPESFAPAVRPIELSLQGFGTGAGIARAEIRRLQGGERVRRALLGPAVGLGIAVLVLPIPVVHFMLPPVAIVAGIVIGVRRGLARELFLTARGTCPRCNREQGLGLNGAAFQLPREIKCGGCGHLLTLEARPTDGRSRPG